MVNVERFNCFSFLRSALVAPVERGDRFSWHILSGSLRREVGYGCVSPVAGVLNLRGLFDFLWTQGIVFIYLLICLFIRRENAL